MRMARRTSMSRSIRRSLRRDTVTMLLTAGNTTGSAVGISLQSGADTELPRSSQLDLLYKIPSLPPLNMHLNLHFDHLIVSTCPAISSAPYRALGDHMIVSRMGLFNFFLKKNKVYYIHFSVTSDDLIYHGNATHEDSL